MKYDALITEINELSPGFSEYVSSDDNYYDKTSIHGIFSAFSHYVRENSGDNDWHRIAIYINSIVAKASGDINNAACTCFLENLAEHGHPIEGYLVGPAKDYWNNWA